MSQGSSAAQRLALAVVIATRDRPEHLDACLANVRSSIGPDDELIVVDSCSSSTRTAEVAREHMAHLVRSEVPGASLARNIGWRTARAPVVAFVDDDVRVSGSWASGLRGSFVAHPEADFVSGRLSLRHEDAGASRPVAFIDYERPYVIDGLRVKDLGHGANLAIRREALEAVRGYDERLGPGAPWPAAEDLDLIDRLLLAGYRGRYEPAAVAFHVQWRTRRDLVALEWRYGVGQGARLAFLRRRDRARHRALAHMVWREQGTGQLAECLRRRQELGTILVICRLAGTMAGQLSATVARRRDRNAS